MKIILLPKATPSSAALEANRFSASQEIPSIVWNPKGYYRFRKRPLPASLLSQINPANVSPSQAASFSQVIPPKSCMYLMTAAEWFP